MGESDERERHPIRDVLAAVGFAVILAFAVPGVVSLVGEYGVEWSAIVRDRRVSAPYWIVLPFACLFVLLILTGTVSYTWLAVRGYRERNSAPRHPAAGS